MLPISTRLSRHRRGIGLVRPEVRCDGARHAVSRHEFLPWRLGLLWLILQVYPLVNIQKAVENGDL